MLASTVSAFAHHLTTQSRTVRDAMKETAWTLDRPRPRAALLATALLSLPSCPLPGERSLILTDRCDWWCHTPLARRPISWRALAERLGATLGQPVIVDNRAGAGGTLGADNVAKSPADGYSIVLGTDATHATNIFLSKRFPYNPVKSFSPIAATAVNHIVLIVHPLCR